MGCCEALMRAILIIINIVVSAAGVVLLIVGGIYLTKQWDFFDGLAEYSSSIKPVLVPMMVMGGILLVVGLVGCIGACSQKSGLLNIYFVVILVCVVAELIVLIYGYVKKDSIKKEVKKGTEDYFAQYKAFVNGNKNDLDDSVIFAVNVLQSVAECCGTTDEKYWGTGEKYPPGCCKSWDGKNQTWDENNALMECKGQTDIYTEGCIKRTEDLVNGLGVLIIIVIALIIVFEIFCMIAACVAKKNDYVA